MTSDIVIANLDAEIHWARRARHSVRDLPASVLNRISAYGTLVHALWPDARRLWTPRPVPSACLRRIPGIPPIEDARCVVLDEAESTRARTWAVAPPRTGDEEALDAAMRVNDRRFAHDLAVELGVQIPGSVVVASWEDVLRARRAQARWVLKTPYGTAGRGFVHGRFEQFDQPSGERQARRLLDAHGALLFEPWLTRRVDIGVVVAPDGATHMHRILSGAAGQFGGIAMGETPEVAIHRSALLAIVGRVAERLAQAGFVGAFGIDAFIDGDGQLVPLCEINGRYTFGHVAHALRHHVAESWGGDAAVSLHFGDREEVRGDPTVLPLLGSADAVRMHAWLSKDV